MIVAPNGPARSKGNAVFKRRKPEDGATRDYVAPPGSAQVPQPAALFAPVPFSGEDPIGPAGLSDAVLDGGGGAALPDSGLGVPPFRPALPKEASMARSPMPMSNVPMPQPPGVPHGAQQGGSQQLGAQQVPMGGPGYGTPPGGQPRPAPMRPQPAGPERRTLVVGRGISVQGTVQDAERLVVEGTVEASLIKATELSIALGGLFKGEVEVTDAEVAGTIDGTLTASGNLIVRATGKVLGIARCRRLQVEDGGAITGRIEMLGDGARVEAPKADVSPEAVA